MSAERQPVGPNEQTSPLRVCVAGATGWLGRPLAEAIVDAPDLTLASAVARVTAGSDLGSAWGGEPFGVVVTDILDEALADVDVLLEVTSHLSAKQNALAAVARGVHVVIGSSGLSAVDFDEIDAAARAAGVGVVAAANFSLTAAMALAAAVLVAPHLPNREIIDFGAAGKPDAPTGTAREMAERLGFAPPHPLLVPVQRTSGHPEARGATIAGTQVHSVRLPGFVGSTEVLFTLPDERLVIRHDAGPTPLPYVAGALVALRAAPRQVGLVRGLDRLLLGG